MGEIRKQLATEADQNRLRNLPETPAPVPALAPERKSSLVTLMAGLVVSRRRWQQPGANGCIVGSAGCYIDRTASSDRSEI